MNRASSNAVNAAIGDAINGGFTEPCRDALWGHVYLRPEFDEMTRTAQFQRLHRIAQLGPASLVYPGATHTRAAHSIGVYHLARRLIAALCERGASGFVTPAGIRSFLCAALLHDLGHFPYAHALKELPLERHEALGAKLLEGEPLAGLIGRAGGDAAFTAAILDTARETASAEVLFYRQLLSGCLDPDKLDYLNRDAYFAGVPYGTQDVDFILSRLYPHRERGVDIDSRAIPSVESVLFSKYLMYRTVYWHKSVRAATAVMKKALYDAIEGRIIVPEELYNLDDTGLLSLIKQRKGPGSPASFDAALALPDGKLFSCALEVPLDTIFDTTSNEHRGPENEAYRRELEAELTRRTGVQVIIDVPEHAGFETGLYVLDEACPFEASSTVFKREVIAAFVKTLRTARFFVDETHKNLLLSMVGDIWKRH